MQLPPQPDTIASAPFVSPFAQVAPLGLCLGAGAQPASFRVGPSFNDSNMATSGADTTSAWQPGQPTNSTIFNASAFQANQLDRHAQPIWQTSAPQFPSSGFTAAMQSEARLTGSAPAALEGYEQFQGFAAVPSCQLPFTFSATTPSTEPQVPALVGLQGQPDFKLNPAGNKDVASTSGTVAVKEEQPMSR